MPGDAIVNPEDLIRFARALKAFDSELMQIHARMQMEFQRVSQTWRDQQQQKFSGEFEQMTQLLRHFHQTAEQHVPQLMGKAGLAQDYLNHAR
jgi:uncharacterized protein YukE